ncbi:ATP-binding cassette domain-containing protein [Kroppenstedtia eburnea]|uniref:ABC-2 type transport system ATP-binding protein n=1 Tax=Kroppenstedtia eburnea TaxID=714067 RepID=A0A1N7L844_9BACL|nr:ABC transporter ATP-binding protein [Kroppenstedtia eburnea]QKI81482.1 ABC transporter ATP-binding protein [Kroppenstedtia eburnea]SIS69941.1 ABC-2 type transport system ATP-binding protein [Kroppenstedtia eburnea]
MSVVQTNNLVKAFGKATALKGVNLEVEEGEVYGFIGPNGAGKSTTIRILLGMLRATSGTATIFGRDVWRDAVAIHERLAYVPGEVNLWPNLTGGEVIDLFASMKKQYSKARERILIDQFALDVSKKCRTYSKGNRQKVALISAFASEADLYILDEPTSGLDPLMERTFQECVLKAKSRGKSILLSSHILSEVERLCDRIGIIRQGEIIESGTLQEMRHLTRTNLTMTTVKPPLQLEQQPGVHEVVKDGDVVTFQVDTEHLASVIQYVSTFGVTSLESAQPTLEDLFMRHYEGSKQR